ncbi:NtaA/DmoA family FMN-dependent monooxygenase [Bacillus inaquosorum]|uniref:NtaA/DmoA family FMN-dependent monooxygenase n=1 Tax=Bacillus inaquosorum TaxID=483913 RepID=UPI002282180C|nr:NtaA/DmoA family FMN-dependent monooxygenase [Bacillus inaquosorum]MCY7766796.1 NtaA/DmoA family FMN-dependent monooxygenase [Bacillus inaquosorum]MCY7952876.1 NtaA/DmoA family FMN-dependent monooxygenase [Bacillus inaquosorum]MCY8725543.1 NtaA/DmoA family FMN-dependent monooxygenase [Bacillus inaquosorum]MCY9308037.1 NtaA/DmoA family FMN-dependent monooxygenase [Bacillus inaquosorum]MCY9344416.1 NtaA/DmoA family FMN-dependent monooxygenase [Bacillus inaquosorum]
MKKRPKMQLVMQMGSGYGLDQGAWRMPNADPAAYMNIDVLVELAKIAERGKIQMIFFADTPALTADISNQPPITPMDPIILLTALARETKQIGLITTLSTTFNYPYNVARQLKALDVISNGRIGVNFVTTSHPGAAVNFRDGIPGRQERYHQAHEFIQIVQALWGSWEEDALILDVKNGKFADMDKIRPINMTGDYLTSKGPLPIPPSEQGQPVIFTAGGGDEGLKIAGRYASGVYANPYDIESSRIYREMVRSSAKHFGRDPDEVKVIPGIIPSIASNKEEALERRRQLDRNIDLRGRVQYLGTMIGIPLSFEQIDLPVQEEMLKYAYANPQDPRSSRALELVKEGMTIRDVLAHGVINYHPVIVGTAEEVADFMEEWFVKGACDGFAIQPDVSFDGIRDFVDQVVPILQERGLFHDDYEGTTLRDHMEISYQYGLSKEI